MRASFLDTFRESLPSCLARIEAAAEAGDDAELRRVAHLLKGSSATLGASGLRLACQALEHSGRDGDSPVDRAAIEQLQSIATEALTALQASLL